MTSPLFTVPEDSDNVDDFDASTSVPSVGVQFSTSPNAAMERFATSMGVPLTHHTIGSQSTDPKGNADAGATARSRRLSYEPAAQLNEEWNNVMRKVSGLAICFQTFVILKVSIESDFHPLDQCAPAGQRFKPWHHSSRPL